MNDFSDIKSHLSRIEGKLDTHIANFDNLKARNEEHHSTLYDKETGLVYRVDRQCFSSKVMMALFGIPIGGWLLQAIIEKLKH